MNIAFAILQVNIILVDYLRAVVEPYHRAFANWQIVDSLALVFVHVLLVLIAWWIFTRITNTRIRKLLPYYYALGYLAYFLEISFYIVLPLLVLISIKDFKFIAKYEQQILRAVLATSIVFTFSYYYQIFNAKAVDHKCSYTSSQPHVTKNLKPTNVFFFIFDKLSYLELYELNSKKPGLISDQFPNFRDFSQQAWNFHTAFSPYPSTSRSIPMIIGLDQPGPVPEILSDKNYSTHLWGNYINYCDLLPQLTSCKSYSWYHMPSTLDPFTTSCLRHLLYIPNAGKHFYRWIFFGRTKNYFDKRRAVVLQNNMEADFFNYIDTKPTNSFAYVHFNVPHPPYVYSSKIAPSEEQLWQEYINVFDKKPRLGLRESYLLNLSYADALFGRIISRLKERGLYEDALIIVTADHSFQDNPAVKDLAQDAHAQKLFNSHSFKKPKQAKALILKTHVPLIIKNPGQSQREDSVAKISNSKLFAVNGSSLFDLDLEFNHGRISKLGDKIFILPKPSKDFVHEPIKNDKLIVISHVD